MNTDNEQSPAGKVKGVLSEILLTVLYTIVVFAILFMITRITVYSVLSLAQFGSYGNIPLEILPSLLLFTGGEVYSKRIGKLRFITRITCVIFWMLLTTYYTLVYYHYFESI